MRASRRSLLVLAAPIVAVRQAGAQEGWPARPIRVIVPRAPGGGTDILARLLSAPVSARIGQPIVVENRPDATTILGAEYVARSRSDGYTFLAADNSFYFNPSFTPRLPYDTLADFAPVTMLAQAPLILLATPAVPVSNLAELIAFSRANPGRLNLASGGIASSAHYATIQLNLAAGIDVVHVAYRSAGPALAALLAGDCNLHFGGVSSAGPLIREGRVRAIASTTKSISPIAAAIPSFAEAGLPGVDVASVWGVHAPAGTPLAIRRRLRDAVAAAMDQPETAAQMLDRGYERICNTPEEHQAQTNSMVNTWIEIGRRVDLTR